MKAAEGFIKKYGLEFWDLKILNLNDGIRWVTNVYISFHFGEFLDAIEIKVLSDEWFLHNHTSWNFEQLVVDIFLLGVWKKYLYL